MFYYISKILWFFLQPSNAVLILLLLGIALLWSRWPRTGRWIVLAAGVTLLIGGLSPLGHALILPLEERFSRADLKNDPPPDGIIILGGAQSMSIASVRGVIVVNEAGERLLETAILGRRFPDATVIFSGGSGGLFGDRLSEAEAAVDLFAGLGLNEKTLYSGR